MQKIARDTVYTVKSVDKAIQLLEILSDYQPGYSVIELAEQTGLNRNKTFRLLSTLCDKGLVDRDASLGIYQLGIYSVALGQKFIKNANVVNFAHPIIEELARKHGEAVYMSVIKDDEVLFLDMADCDQQVKASPLIGRRFPFFTNAAGKVMKSFDSRDLLERLLKKKGAHELENLDRELNEIRAKGVAVDKGGLGEGIISVAVAIRDYTGKVIGAITLIGPSFRMLAGRIEQEIIPSLIEEGGVLSGKFGYAPA